MRKVNYIQPQMQVMALMPTTIVCASGGITQGDPITGTGDTEEGD